MNSHFIQKHYPLSNLDFRDLWDITSHFRGSHPALQHIVYSVETANEPIANEESDVSLILQKIAKSNDPVESIRVRLTPEAGNQEMPSSELAYFRRDSLHHRC